MKTPNGSIDLIGTGMQIGLGVIDLVNHFKPSKEQIDDKRRARKVRVAIRQLTHRFKNADVEAYVNVNFASYTEDARREITALIRSTINR